MLSENSMKELKVTMITSKMQREISQTKSMSEAKTDDDNADLNEEADEYEDNDSNDDDDQDDDYGQRIHNLKPNHGKQRCERIRSSI